MQIQRRTVTAERVLSLQEFERMLQRAEKFQKVHGPQLLAKARPAHKRSAPAA